jgi:hypothetical protein
LSWFSEKYFFRIEEGLPKDTPSKIEAVLKDGKDFDDVRLANLRRQLQNSVFPTSDYMLYFETDEFRRFVRIYVDRSDRSVPDKEKRDHGFNAIIPKDEIEKRLLDAK